MSLIETYVISTDYGALSELPSIELLLVNFLSNIISPLLDEEYCQALLHLVCYHLMSFEFADLHRIHELFHKLAKHFIVISIVGELHLDAPESSFRFVHLCF